MRLLSPHQRRLRPLLILGLAMLLSSVGMAAPSIGAAGTTTLRAGEQLVAGQSVSSGSYRLLIQSDGNAVVYGSSNRVRWHSGTHGKAGARLVMQSDGNAVVYSSAGRALWHSRTYGHPGARLVVQSDGNLVVYSASNRALWHIGPDKVSSPPATTTTGAGVPSGTTLRAYTGPRTITTPGTVLDRADISGGIEVRASGVVIRNSRIRGSSGYGVLVRSGSVAIEQSTVSGFENGIAGNDYRASRVLVTGASGDGFKIGSRVTIEGSVCRDLAPASGAHADCGQIQSGVTDVMLRGNWFDVGSSRGNAALFVAPDLGPSTRGPVTIQGNTFGGGNYTVFILDGDYGRFFIDSISLKDNRFLRNATYGPLRINVPVSRSNNVWLDTGTPVPSG